MPAGVAGQRARRRRPPGGTGSRSPDRVAAVGQPDGARGAVRSCPSRRGDLAVRRGLAVADRRSCSHTRCWNGGARRAQRQVELLAGRRRSTPSSWRAASTQQRVVVDALADRSAGRPGRGDRIEECGEASAGGVAGELDRGQRVRVRDDRAAVRRASRSWSTWSGLRRVRGRARPRSAQVEGRPQVHERVGAPGPPALG